MEGGKFTFVWQKKTCLINTYIISSVFSFSVGISLTAAIHKYALVSFTELLIQFKMLRKCFFYAVLPDAHVFIFKHIHGLEFSVLRSI